MEKNKVKTVLVTRAREQSLPLKAALRKAGAKVIDAPLIKIGPPKSWKPFANALRCPGRCDWIVITSVNGAQYFLKGLKRLKIKSRDLAGNHIAAVGKKTAGCLAAAGLKVRLVPKIFTSEALFEALRKKTVLKGKEFLLLRSEIATGYLPEKLKAAGAKVRDVPVYRTLPVRGALKERLAKQLIQGKIDYVTLTSESTVRNFFSALPKRSWLKIRTRFITIGPVTSAALREYGWRTAAEAKQHTISGIVEAFIHDTKR
jgi:uroporphyrinogen III methyltransferase/synthase